jgi:hypothetical protein
VDATSLADAWVRTGGTFNNQWFPLPLFVKLPTPDGELPQFSSSRGTNFVEAVHASAKGKVPTRGTLMLQERHHTLMCGRMNQRRAVTLGLLKDRGTYNLGGMLAANAAHLAAKPRTAQKDRRQKGHGGGQVRRQACQA